MIRASDLLSLEEQDCAVAEVEVDEVLRLCLLVSLFPFFALLSTEAGRHLTSPQQLCNVPQQLTVRHEAAEIAADDAVPSRALSLVKLFR